MALSIATGLVVDVAIVMLENIVRHLEAGDDPLAAALKGARQISFTVISLTISLVAVFIPILLMEGIIGRLFREFAVTLALAVIVSCMVSLTLTPMMCGHLLDYGTSRHSVGRLYRWSERTFDKLLGLYVKTLDWVLAHRAVALVFTALTMLGTGLLYSEIPKGFIPQQDTGLLVGSTDAPQDISFPSMAREQQDIARAVGNDPDVASVNSFIGAGSVTPTLNSGRLYITLTPRDKRPPAQSIVERLKANTEKFRR
jgi:multidrug efflux pump